MPAPPYLRRIAARGSAEPRGTTLAPWRMLFRPIPPSAVLPLEAETAIAAPSRLAVPEPDPQAAIESRVPPPTGAAAPPPIAAPRPESGESERAWSGRIGIAQQEVLPPREQGVRRDPMQRDALAAKPAPAAVTAGPAPRTADRKPIPARAPAPSPDARASLPIPLQRSMGSGEVAAGSVRDLYPALVRDQPVSQTLRPLSAPGDLHGRGLREPEVARTGSAQHIAAREERILLTPPVASAPLRSSGPRNTGTSQVSATGRVRIGSLEVHVTAPPPIIAPLPSPPAPRTITLSGRAATLLARGFPGFGLVQS